MNGYVSSAEEVFPTAVTAIEDAVARAADKVEREKARLVRPDGSRVYSDAEHAERMKAIEEVAGAEYDAATARHLMMAAEARAKAEAELARLDGQDGWEALCEAERQAASLRQPFIREDAEGGRPDQIVRQARAALAAKDKPAVYLWARYLRRRVENGDTGHGGELAGVLRDLEAVFSGDPTERHRRRRELERRIEATKSLVGRVEAGRRRVNGSEARALESMRREMLARF